MADEHLRSDHYVEIDGLSTAATVARCIHSHLIATCPECEEAWHKLGALLKEAVLSSFDTFTPPPAPSEPTDDDLLVDAGALAAEDAKVEQLRHLRRRAHEQLWILRRLPAVRRAGKIRGAHRQFRGRALAELLIEECRATVRNAPLEAVAWVDLVPLVLHWTRGDGAPPWAPGLLARAAAHRANALRIAGDFLTAERTFIEVRRSLAAHPVDDPAIVAEVASLEASLRIDQHHEEQAEELLERAALAYRYAGDPLGLARTRIKHATLMWDEDRPAEVLRLLEEASAGLAASPEPPDLYLTLCTVTWRLLALCELKRFAEARRLLHRNLDDYEASEDPLIAATLRTLEGRMAHGLGEYEKAEQSYRSCLDAYLTLGRNHDAALACLDLADTLLAAGKTSELRQLASDLVPLFRTRDLPAETMRALDHLTRAVVSERLSTAVLTKMRRALATRAVAPPPPPI